jgi:hypothetical protein
MADTGKKVKNQCQSIKSKKHPDQRCPNQANKDGKWCAKHINTKITFEENISLTSISSKPRPKSNPKTLNESSIRIQKFWMKKGRSFLKKEKGLLTYVPKEAHNDKDIYSYEPVETIPLTYRFSYLDEKGHAWLFDLRFLLHLLQYGNDLKNPFTQEAIPGEVLERLQKRASRLRSQNVAIVYLEKDELTPEQIWNQKVLDVFLKFTALGYGANVLWFETMHIRHHEGFYIKLWDLWNTILNLTPADKERIVPGYDSGRAPLFRWNPNVICGRGFDLKWWRKQNLMLMKAFLNRAEDKHNQGCGALYVLTALANTHPHCGQAFPWLLAE